MIRPNKKHLQELAGVLESGDFETPEDAVIGVLRHYWEQLGERQFKVCVAKVGGYPVVVGPFATANQANKLFGGRVGQMYTPEGWKQQLAKADVLPTPKGDWRRVAEDAEAARR